MTFYSKYKLTYFRLVQIHENGADAHQPVMPQFGGPQYSPMQDPSLKNVESPAVAPSQTTTSAEPESHCSAVEDLAMNRVEHHIAGLAQARTMTVRESQPPSGDGELAIHAVEHHVEAPAQTLTLTKCDICSEKGRSCDGNQGNGKSCTACINSKQVCSFIPRKYACELCLKHFIRQRDLVIHNTKAHKKPNLKAPKKSTFTGDTPTPSRRLRKDFQQSTPTGDASRPSKRIRNDSKKQRYADVGML